MFRIRSAKAEGVGVVDVDGTYLERKRQSLVSSNVNVAPLPPPNFPLHGWQSVEESNAEQIATQLPCQRCILTLPKGWGMPEALWLSVH